MANVINLVKCHETCNYPKSTSHPPHIYLNLPQSTSKLPQSTSILPQIDQKSTSHLTQIYLTSISLVPQTYLTSTSHLLRFLRGLELIALPFLKVSFHNVSHWYLIDMKKVFACTIMLKVNGMNFTTFYALIILNILIKNVLIV